MPIKTVSAVRIKTALAATVAAAIFGVSAVSTAPALAQVKAVPEAGSKQVIPEKKGAAIESGRSDSLSGKLSNSGGIITPSTNVDPGMKVPTPDVSHSMPVIPPSATGGDSAK